MNPAETLRAGAACPQRVRAPSRASGIRERILSLGQREPIRDILPLPHPELHRHEPLVLRKVRASGNRITAGVGQSWLQGLGNLLIQ